MSSTVAHAGAVHLVGRSDAIRALEAEIDCAAPSDAKILITGETGVGKELVARLVHKRSARASAPLVTLNCAGLPDSLLESELFGHVRGSFTGAYRDKPGILEAARNGTVFLDEVGEMSPRMQVVLLRFLESGEIQRVGADRSHTRVDVRLVTATNRDLEKEVANGTFREDLFFRLNVIRLLIPPLRERADDIPLLVDYYLRTYSQMHRVPQPEITPDALDILIAHRWPGNIRQLKNVIERIVLKAGGGVVNPGNLPPDVAGNIAARKPAPATAVAQVADATPVRSHVDELIDLLLKNRESFWSAVYPLFMARDMTRKDLRTVVQAGLERTNGNYRLMVELFNMPPEDYKRFLSFLRKHDCLLPFQRFRTVAASRLRSAALGNTGTGA
ncbi:MAG: sigma 54-interacting transcriptional regulator [Acidobacteria bacterium]|nr:sigma 54-interacting transcriptional regulator [Acidobacteriota bacterium]